MFELAGYETLDLIGGGGFGEVWLAAQNSTGRNVAVKVAHAPIVDETLQIRFEREYKALGRLSGHPNIVDIVTAGTLPDGRAYLVLEFIEGGTLWERSQHQRVEEDDLIDIGIELAKALNAAHSAGVLHRDVKPENVLLRQTGEAVLSDFGLAHLTDGAVTSPNAVVASVAYAAPEILRGEGASSSTDIYGLGVCLLTAAIRSVPFVELHDKSIQTVIQRVLSDSPKDVSRLGYSSLFNSLISDLMAKDANDRIGTADEALRRLEELPQLRRDQDFSWSDFLGAPETSVDSAELITAEFTAIGTDETDTVDVDINNDINQSSSPAEPSDGADPQNGAEQTKTQDEIDKLISELTGPQKTVTDDAQVERDASNQDDGEVTDSAIGNDSSADSSTADVSSADSSTADVSSADISEPASSVDDLGEDPANPVEQQTINPAPGTSRAASPIVKPDGSAQTDAVDETPRSPETRGDNDAAREATMEMPALTIGQQMTLGDSSPGPSPKTTKSNTRVNPDTKPTASIDESSDSADVPNDNKNFLDRLIEPSQVDNKQTATPSSNHELSPAPKPSSNKPAELGKSALPQAAQRPPSERPFGRLAVGLAALVGIVLLTGLVLQLVVSNGNDEPVVPSSSRGGQSLLLPLSLDDEGFPAGTIEATTPSLGPTSPLFCENLLEAVGVTSWKGSQFLTPDQDTSVEQLVVGFESDEAADLYMSEIEESLDCPTWSERLFDRNYSVEAQATTASVESADRSTDFDLTASSADGSELVGKTHLIRVGANIAVIEVMATSPDTLEELVSTTEQAGSSLSERAAN